MRCAGLVLENRHQRLAVHWIGFVPLDLGEWFCVGEIKAGRHDIKHVTDCPRDAARFAFQAGRPMTLAIVPTGYYEGYDRHLSNIGRAIVRGQPVQVVGRVAMNMTILDVSDVDGPKLDEEVVLLGQQGKMEVSADELADKIGTIPYEVLARINAELERKLI